MADKRKLKQQKSNRRSGTKDKPQGSERNEFRKRNKGGGDGHIQHIYRKVGNTYEFIGITHSKVTRGVKNIKLDRNPDPKDRDAAYLKPTPEKASTREFRKKPECGIKFADSDLPKVEAVKKKPVKDHSKKKKR